MVAALLPSNCTLRSATLRDKWVIFWLVFKLQGEISPWYDWLGKSILMATAAVICFSLIFGSNSPIWLSMLWIGIFLSIPFYCSIRAIKAWSSFWLVECNGRVIACVSLANRETYFALNDLYVEPQWRNQGIGSVLVNHLTQNFPAKVIALWCRPKLVSFYTHSGFVAPQPTEPLFTQYGNGQNANQLGFNLLLYLPQQ